MIAWDETERRANPGRFTGEEVLLLFSGDMLIEILGRGVQGTVLLAAQSPPHSHEIGSLSTIDAEYSPKKEKALSFGVLRSFFRL